MVMREMAKSKPKTVKKPVQKAKPVAKKAGAPKKIAKVKTAKAAKPVKKPARAAVKKKSPLPIKAKTAAKKALPKPKKAEVRKAKPAVKPRAVSKPAPAEKKIVAKGTLPVTKPLSVASTPPSASGRKPPPVQSTPSQPNLMVKAPEKKITTFTKQATLNKKGKMGETAALTGSDSGITIEDGRYALPATTQIDLPKGYKPSSKEEYMNPQQLAYFRAKLMKWREDLVEESKQTIDNLREEVRDVGDEAERATRETENSLELRTRDRYRKLIAKIDKALKRIEDGRYGYCEETDEDIGIERLEARPIATLCLDAQERWEHRQKQMGD